MDTLIARKYVNVTGAQLTQKPYIFSSFSPQGPNPIQPSPLCRWVPLWISAFSLARALCCTSSKCRNEDTLELASARRVSSKLNQDDSS